MANRADRESFFPAIENKYGQPMSYWFDQMASVAGQRYPEQIAFLRENHGFTQAHANAVVMYSRGSKSARRSDSIDEYCAEISDVQAKTIKEIFRVITKKFPELELVIAWNQPMVKHGSTYVFGAAALKNHILIAPMVEGVLDEFRSRLDGYHVNKKTLRVPSDWNVDAELLHDMTAACIAAADK
jgi:uncharacterized protein